MKKIFLLIHIVLVCIPSFAQKSVDDLLSIIEGNNKGLMASRAQIDAEQLKNKTDISLDDIEVEFKHKWPSRNNELDDFESSELEITQNLDLQTVFGIKHRMATKQNSVLDAEYMKERSKILYNAWQLLANYAYIVELYDSISANCLVMKHLSDVYERKVEVGESTILDYNSVFFSYQLAMAAKDMLSIELDNCVEKLTVLNGGKPIDLSNFVYQDVELPIDFESWYKQHISSNSNYLYYMARYEQDDYAVKVGKTSWLPSLWLGYTGDYALGESNHGVIVGMSIPLWANTNKVKSAKAAKIATELEAANELTNLKSELKIAHIKASRLYGVVDGISSRMGLMHRKNDINKALENGVIDIESYNHYRNEFYDIYSKFLEIKLNYRLACIDLLYGTK